MFRPQPQADRLEGTALSAFLLVCFLLAFLKDIFPALENGLTAALFAALFFTVRQIHGLRTDLCDSGGPSEIFFATNEEFYCSARAAVQEAEREIRVTYFRPAPPTALASGRSMEYFDEIINFARTRGTVRRIIGVSTAAMAQWCAEQTTLVAKHPRYKVRIIRTDHQRVEPMSMALIDDDIMYMAFPGPTDQQLGGIREDAPKLAHFHQSRFDQLWERGVELEEFVSSDYFATLVID